VAFFYTITLLVLPFFVPPTAVFEAPVFLLAACMSSPPPQWLDGAGLSLYPW